MKIGNKMLELRKQNNMSQEQLAEKMNVARQTISKWELGETSPDLEQSKRLSQIFNEIKNILFAKVSNMERLTKVVINILKIILIVIFILVTVLVSKIFFEEYFSVEPNSLTISFLCVIDDIEYSYRVFQSFEKPNILQIYTRDNNLNINSSKYDDYNWLIEDINKNVVSRGGKCFIEN